MDELLDRLGQDLVGAKGDPVGKVSGKRMNRDGVMVRVKVRVKVKMKMKMTAMVQATVMMYQKSAETMQAVRSQADEEKMSVSMW